MQDLMSIIIPMHIYMYIYIYVATCVRKKLIEMTEYVYSYIEHM